MTLALDEIAALPFESAYGALQEIITRLESGEPTLAESVTLYEQGRHLSQRCQQLLDQAELRITQLSDADGAMD